MVLLAMSMVKKERIGTVFANAGHPIIGLYISAVQRSRCVSECHLWWRQITTTCSNANQFSTPRTNQFSHPHTNPVCVTEEIHILHHAEEWFLDLQQDHNNGIRSGLFVLARRRNMRMAMLLSPQRVGGPLYPPNLGRSSPWPPAD